MNTTATHARTLLALGTLTTASAICWALDAFDHLSSHDDRIDLAAAMTLTILTGLAACTARACAQRERLRKSYEADRDLYTRALADNLSPKHGGGGVQAPGRPERPAWVLYQKEPAA